MKLNFISKPNLPSSRVGELIIGTRYRSLLENALNRLGIEVLSCPDNNRLSNEVRGHVDLSIVHLGGKSLVIDSMLADSSPLFVKMLTNRGLELLTAEQQNADRNITEYSLCSCLLGKHFIHSLKNTDKTVLSNLDEHTNIINVRQGYSKCSVCIVDDNSIITSDSGIARALRTAGISTLEITPGYIYLKGYSYGFIGGSAFKISNNQLAFTGSLKFHPDCCRIERYLESKNIEPVYLNNEPIFDVGSAILLREYSN